MTILRFHGQCKLVITIPRNVSRDGNLPDRETVPETTESNILVDATHGATEAFTGLSVGVEFADHDVGWVRDDGAEDTGEVTAGESDTGLSTLGVVRFLAGEAVVDHFDNGFEGGEFHHGVRDLTTPERSNTLIETRNTMLSAGSSQ